MKYLSFLLFALLLSSCGTSKKATEPKEMAQSEVTKTSEMDEPKGGSFEPPKEDNSTLKVKPEIDSNVEIEKNTMEVTGDTM